MTYLVAWTHPEGSGYSAVEATSHLDACRVLRYLMPNYSARMRIVSVMATS